MVLTGSILTAKSTLASVKDGHISLQEPEKITIAELKVGSIFGEVSLIIDRSRNTSVLADAVQVVDMKIFNLSIQKKFQTQLIQVLVQRLDDLYTKYINLKAATTKEQKKPTT